MPFLRATVAFLAEAFFLGEAFFLAALDLPLPKASTQLDEYWLFEPLCNTVTFLYPFL